MRVWRSAAGATAVAITMMTTAAAAEEATRPVPASVSGTLALAGATVPNWAAIGTIAHAVGAMGTSLTGDGTGRSLALAALPDATRGRSWTAWVTARDLDWNGAGDDRYDARQRSLVGGVGWQVTPDLLVGVLAGRERLSDDVPTVPGQIDGDGTGYGVYAGWRLLPGLRFDAALTRALMDYDIRFGAAPMTLTGGLEGRRWVVSTGLTGLAQYAGVVFEPSARFYLARERQDEVTGTLRYLLTSNEMEVGRVSSGGRAAYPVALETGTLTPSIGAFADWRFGDASLGASGVSFAPANGWTGRLNAGLSLAHAATGVSVTGFVERAGLGGDAPSWTGQVLLTVAF